MLRVTRRLTAILIALLFAAHAFVAFPAAAAAEEPAVQTIDTFYATLLDVMKHADQLKFAGRYEKLKPAIEDAFNLPLMTRLTVGPQWSSIPAAQQEQLTAEFSDYTISTYANRFDGYSGEKFEVDPAPAASSGGVIVKTDLVKSDGDKISLNYLMRESGGALKIIDVFLSGTASELATRRSEFTSVLRRDGPDGLIRLLQQRSADLKKAA
ncbi:MAG TPA: ABC transporter substrate-binding protein [Stellaceae bacterium]